MKGWGWELGKHWSSLEQCEMFRGNYKRDPDESRGRHFLEIYVVIKIFKIGPKGGTLWPKWTIKQSVAVPQVTDACNMLVLTYSIRTQRWYQFFLSFLFWNSSLKNKETGIHDLKFGSAATHGGGMMPLKTPLAWCDWGIQGGFANSHQILSSLLAPGYNHGAWSVTESLQAWTGVLGNAEGTSLEEAWTLTDVKRIKEVFQDRPWHRKIWNVWVELPFAVS